MNCYKCPHSKQPLLTKLFYLVVLKVAWIQSIKLNQINRYSRLFKLNHRLYKTFNTRQERILIKMFTPFITWKCISNCKIHNVAHGDLPLLLSAQKGNGSVWYWWHQHRRLNCTWKLEVIVISCHSSLKEAENEMHPLVNEIMQRLHENDTFAWSEFVGQSMVSVGKYVV